jgi:hypothetical protein
MAEDDTCLLRSASDDRSALAEKIGATPDFDRVAPCAVPGVC